MGLHSDYIGLRAGGQMNFYYFDTDGEQSFTEGADNEERVKAVAESFL